MSKTQIMWGKSKIIAIEHLAPHLIGLAKEIVENALTGKIGFAFAKFKVDAFGFDKTGYRKCKSNYRKLKFALRLLSKNGYIANYTLTSDGVLRIKHWEDIPQLEENTVKENKKGAPVTEIEKPNIINYESLKKRDFLYYKWRPSLDAKIEQQKLHDQIGCSKVYLDGRPSYHKPQQGIPGLQYEDVRKHNVKIANLPANHVEGLSK